MKNTKLSQSAVRAVLSGVFVVAFGGETLAQNPAEGTYQFQSTMSETVKLNAK